MPEQFFALTHSAGLPVSKAPPPPLQSQTPTRASGQAPSPKPPVSAPVPAPVVATAAAVSAAPATPAQPPPTGLPIAEGKRNMFVVWGVVGGVIVIGGGLAAFFVLRSVPRPSPVTRPPAPAPVNVAPPPTPTPPVNVAPTPEPVPPPAPPPAVDKDTDGDGLTDAEELVLGTDVNLADSDRDSYPDGVELQNLYNPAGVAPQRILDAGLVYEYEHPTFGWKMYIPRAWSIAATDQGQREAHVTTGVEGEEIIAKVVEGGADVGPHDANLGQQAVETKRGARGMKNVGTGGIGGVVSEAWFSLPDARTLVLTYRVAHAPARYPHIFDMMVQSVALPAVPHTP